MAIFLDSKNPTDNYYIKPMDDGKYEIWVHFDRASDGSAQADRKHTSAPSFDELDEAEDYLEGLKERYEEQYDQYLEDHHDEILASERYEQYRNEF